MAVKSVLVRLRGDNGDLNRALHGSAAAARVLKKDLDGADDSGRRLSSALETSNDRTTMLIQGALALGPALVPLGAQGVPIIAGLATQLGFATGAAATTLLAFQGVGDSLKAVNEYAVEPTTANFQKMQETLATLGPEGRGFVKFLQDLRPEMQELQNIAQAGWFPGLEDGMESFMERGPQVERIIRNISRTMGDLSAQAGEELAGPEWDEFFRFVQTEANPILSDFSRTMGNLLLGLANMTEAMGPMTADFSNGFLEMSRDFVKWSSDLENSDGYQDFVDYIDRTGPEVWETLGALSNALLQIVEAAAPVGELSLPIITAVANVLATIANSPAGPALIATAAGFSAVSRAIALYNAANGSALLGMLTGAGREGKRAGAGLRAAGAGLGILALSLTDVDDKAGLSNTAMLATMGLVAGPWGAAIGGAVGLTIDLAKANNDLESAVSAADRAMRTGTMDERKQRIKELAAEVKEADGDVTAFWDALGNGAGLGIIWTDIGSAVKGAGIEISGGTSDAANKLVFMRDQLHQTGGIADIFGDVIGATGRQVRIAANDVEALSKSLAELQGWLDKRAAIRNYEQAIDDLRAGLRKNAGAWDASTEAGRANLELIDKTSQGILQMAETMKNPVKRSNFIDGAREDLAKLAKTFPGARGQIQATLRQLEKLGMVNVKPRVRLDDGKFSLKVDNILDELGFIDRKHPKPKLDADSRPAKKKIDAVDQWLGELTGTTARPRVDAETGAALTELDRVRHVMSQIVSKTVSITVLKNVGFREGGWTGPGPVDQVAGVVHGDEHVTRAAARRKLEAARPGALDYMNFTGRWPGYAGGGRVQARHEQPRSVAPAYAGVPSISLEGAHISGTLTLNGDGRTGQLDGRIERIASSVARDEIAADRRFSRVKSGG